MAETPLRNHIISIGKPDIIILYIYQNQDESFFMLIYAIKKVPVIYIYIIIAMVQPKLTSFLVSSHFSHYTNIFQKI